MYRSYVKRLLDFLLAFLALVVLAIPMLIVALAVKFTSKGPIFFWQKRVGMNKETFMMPKFRSMYTETPSDMPTHLLQDPTRWITPVGKVLRKTSLDELPQLLVILTGKMSFIGPRPALWNQDDLVAERDKYGANDVRPGLTGWAQINGRDELPIPVKAKLDGEYIEKLSFAMDVKCFFGTFTAVLFGKGVVEGGTGAMEKSETAEDSEPDSEDAPQKDKYLVLSNHSYMLWQFRRELIEVLLRKGEVVVAVPFGEHVEDFQNLGCKMIDISLDRRGINPIKDIKLYRDYVKLLKAEKPTTVITYSIKPNVYGGYACRRLGIPYCVNVQGLGTAFQKQGLAQLVTFMYKTALKKSKVVFFENQGNADVFLERKIIPEAKICLLPGAGVNLKYYEYCEYPANEKVRFLYLGRLMKEKGMDELFGAVRGLYANNPNFVLDLVGFFEDEYKETVDALVSDGIAVFHGFQKDPRPFYSSADCVVLPSYHEGMSNVLLESAAIGRPIICSDINGCREAVVENESGYLVTVKDASSLQAAMENFCGLSLEERKEMGKKGRQHVETNFNKTDVVLKTLQKVLE